MEDALDKHLRLPHPFSLPLYVDFGPVGGIGVREMERKQTNNNKITIVLEVVPVTQILQVIWFV